MHVHKKRGSPLYFNAFNLKKEEANYFFKNISWHNNLCETRPSISRVDLLALTLYTGTHVVF